MGNDTITSVKGFKAAAIHCGIKSTKKPDLAVLVSDVEATAAAVFTTNEVVGAPVTIGRKHIRRQRLRGCIVNSGCANVCTGQRGLDDAYEMCELTAKALDGGRHMVPAMYILPSSTGVIGHYLPMDKIRAGIPKVIAKLSDSAESGNAFAEGILTTDLVKKTARTTFKLDGKLITIAGCCKGSGMIAPNMATMLGYIATDAAVHAGYLQYTLRDVASRTFNCVTVDQHTSTSDTVAILANGMAGNALIKSGPELQKFTDALYDVCDSLAIQIAKDGEGATKLVKIIVNGTYHAAHAKAAALAIANSPLVKTAIHGGDPNWGRIVSAAGYSGAKMDMDMVTCEINSLVVFKKGRPTNVDLKKVQKAMQGKEITIKLDLGNPGEHSYRVYTCDLSREYITINADYHT